MTFARRRFVKASLALATAGAVPSLAQSFPSRPIRLICPFPPGPGSDAIMRAMAASASKQLGSPVIVENKAGAGGTLGAVEVANARPDGHVLTMIPEAIFIIPHMEKMPFDPLTDFTYVMGVAASVYGLVVKADSPIRSMQDYVAYAKANPGKLSYSTAGIGTINHLVMEELAEKLGVRLLHVPYKGAAPSVTAALSGEVMSCSGQSAWAPHVDRGALRLLATYGSQRTKRWSSVPTLQELGYGVVADAPFGFAGPKGMDPAVTRRLQDVFRTSMEDPAVVATLEANSMQTRFMDSPAYTKLAAEKFNHAKGLLQRLGLSRAG
jgi:tripartite-type tricarboxylate transporter receptor subunit TctC